MTERITIKDIAKALNIHHSTVSRALRNDSRVKEETLKKVRSYAKKHGYQINMSALELRGEKRNTIAVIVPNISHHFFSSIVSYFTNLASDNGYVVSVFQTNESVEREIQIIDTIIQNNFSGVIASISTESKDTSHFNLLKKQNIPLVMYDRVSSDNNAPKVVINNAEIMSEAVTMLSNKGYGKIAHLSGPEHLNVFRERQKGYRAAIKASNLDYEKIIRFESGFSIDDGIEVAKKILDDKIRPNAIISDSSNLIYGLLGEVKKRGLNIPDDIAIIVFGENPSFEVMTPSITSIIQPCEDMANVIYKSLIKEIENRADDKDKTITLSAKVVERKST